MFLTQSLPKSDGTISTDYGARFEISTTAIFVLRCCKQNKSFQVWINRKDYEPWDDIVAQIDDRIMCVQLKHNEKLNKEKLTTYLDKRKELLEKHSSDKNSFMFVYFVTTPDNAIVNNSNYMAANPAPYLLDFLLTNKECVFIDLNNAIGETLLCMNQHNVTKESEDIKQALSEYIGPHYLTDDYLKDIQMKFLDYFRNRHGRLYKSDDPITDQEIRRLLAYIMLNKFKVEYNPSNFKVDVSNNLEEILETSSVVVINHRWSSNFSDKIWYHLKAYLEKKISKKHLKQTNIDEAWVEGKFHMPITSPNKETDKIILRALEIGNFEPKVIILRPRIFTIREGQNIITILQNLNVAEKSLETKTDRDIENFRFVNIELNTIPNNKKLHHDAFTKVTKEYFKGPKNYLEKFVEAHDEENYVNDCNTIGDETLSAICAAIKIKQIDYKIVEYLIKLGADVNASMFGGYRPIYYAVDVNRPDLVELLLKNQANPDPADKYGMRPLFYACLQNKIKIVDLLIKYNSNRSSSDVNGVTPLFMAYDNKNFEIMEMLLRDFDKPAAANTIGSHILHKAAEDGSVECLKIIVKCCPDMEIFMTGNVKGLTPLDIARQNGRQDFVEVLQKALGNEI